MPAMSEILFSQELQRCLRSEEVVPTRRLHKSKSNADSIGGATVKLFQRASLHVVSSDQAADRG